MLTGLGGPDVTHYVGLMSDAPAALDGRHHRRRHRARDRARTAAHGVDRARRRPRPVPRRGGDRHRLVAARPRSLPGSRRRSSTAPSIAVLSLASLFMIRAAAVRVPWMQLSLDATIFVVGFGAFFWFLVIRPAASHAEVDVLKAGAEPGLRRARLHPAADARRAAARRRRQRRRPARAAAAAGRLRDRCSSATSCGRSPRCAATTCPGSLQDVLYLCCYVPMAAAGREQMRTQRGHRRAPCPAPRMSLARSLPYAAMLAAFLVLVYFTPRRHRRPGDR